MKGPNKWSHFNNFSFEMIVFLVELASTKIVSQKKKLTDLLVSAVKKGIMLRNSTVPLTFACKSKTIPLFLSLGRMLTQNLFYPFFVVVALGCTPVPTCNIMAHPHFFIVNTGATAHLHLANSPALMM